MGTPDKNDTPMTYSVSANISFSSLDSVTVREKFGSATYNECELSRAQIQEACVDYALKNNLL